MKNNTRVYASSLVTLAILAMTSLVGTGAASSLSTEEELQIGSTPQPTPRDTHEQLAELEARIDELERQVARHQKDVDFALRDTQWRIDRWVWIAAAIVAILGFLGFQTYRQVNQGIRKRISSTLEQELYSLDPAFISIRIRRDRQLEREYRRLELSGLKNLSWYSDFSKKCRYGITIIPIDGPEDEDEFLRLLDEYQFEPSRAAFVLYAREYRVKSDVIEAYDNLTLANNPTSLAGAILIVGRGLEA